jgi:hypothetical protein
MTHCSDDDLVLHYYAEPCDVDVDAHLATCAECATRYRALSTALAAVADDVPTRGESYGDDVWRAIAPALKTRRSWVPPRAARWTLALAATLALIGSGYVVGRLSTPSTPGGGGSRVAADTADEQARRRILLLSVAEHLERSDRVLTDIMNTSDVDIADEQQWAEDLISASRLYRQDALQANESAVAGVLDELERTLLDIVHRPAGVQESDLEAIRMRIDAAALLFKVRVMSSDIRERQGES